MTKAGPGALTLQSLDDHVRVDFAARSVFVNGDEVSLTRTEFDILAYLASRVGHAVSMRDIIVAVWGDWYGSTSHLFVHMHHIRRKLGPAARILRTKRAVGYLLCDDAHAHRQPPWLHFTQEYLDLLEQDARERSVAWFIVDQDRQVDWVSESITPLLGWQPADLVGRLPWSIAHSDDVDAFLARFPMFGGERLMSFDARVYCADGDVARISVTAQVLLGLGGRRLGGIGEWRRCDEAGSSSAETAMPFVLHYDGDHVLTAVEPHQPFLGWQPHDVIGSPFSLAGFDRDMTARAMASLLAVGQEHDLGRSLVYQANGTPTSVSIRLRLRVEDGALRGYSGEVRSLE